jgi:hypothetical protein
MVLVFEQPFNASLDEGKQKGNGSVNDSKSSVYNHSTIVMRYVSEIGWRKLLLTLRYARRCRCQISMALEKFPSMPL